MLLKETLRRNGTFLCAFQGALLRDARDYQILFLSLFLILGIGTRDWTLHPTGIVAAFIACLLTQIFWSLVQDRIEAKTWFQGGWNLRSAVITALGLSLLLRSQSWETMAIAGILAISSKFLFRVEGKHFFNPANFGIVAALFLLGDAWVSPGQWGEELWYVLLFLGAGGIVLKRVGRWDTSVMFLSSYALLEGIRNTWLGWTPDVLLHRLSSGSLLLFALFMITDPRSIPNARPSRLLWSGAIAVLTFILRNSFYLSTAPFIALFILSPLVPFLDRYWQAIPFTWKHAMSAPRSLPQSQS